MFFVFCRCNIDFVSSPVLNTTQNIIFHISIRPHENAIVRNHFENGRWGHEERYGKYKVRHHETFEIYILADHEFFKIAYNCEHIGVYRHHQPLHLVNYIQVSGDVKVDHILYEQDLSTAAVAAAQGPVIVSQVTSSYGHGGIASSVSAVPCATSVPPGYTPMNVYMVQGPQPPPPYQAPGTVSLIILKFCAVM